MNARANDTTMDSRGLELVKKYEGCELTSYLCPAGVPTIGWGTTRWFDGGPVELGITITQEQADELLERDWNNFSKGVGKLVRDDTSPQQRGAITSFAYNVGLGNLSRSTLLKDHNEGDTEGAAAEFLKWCYAGGKRLVGLHNRRVAERELYLS